ncbi:hypothetical protein C5B96_15005 [Subtercola sp. Z020]|nr:hypothetical protein C5B96_15005 [Subtercola sp. Z020]
MAGSDDATNEQKSVGIIAQTRQDHAGQGLAFVLSNLRERFEQAQVEIDDVSLARIAHEISDMNGTTDNSGSADDASGAADADSPEAEAEGAAADDSLAVDVASDSAERTDR